MVGFINFGVESQYNSFNMTSNIFIKNVNGQSLSFQVDLKTEKVKDLLQKYGKKTGIKPEELQFVYAGKPLFDKQDKLLSQLQINNLSTIYAVGRLRGGKIIKITVVGLNGQQYKIEVDDDLTGYQLKQYFYNNGNKSLDAHTMALRYAGVQIENDKKLSYYKIVDQKGVLKVFQEKCSLGKIAGIILAYQADPYGIDEQTARMPCGHVIGRDGMTQFVRSLIQAHQYKILCPAQKPNGEDCRFEWQFYLCRKIGIFSQEQVKQFQEGLSINWINDQSSQCPNCQYRVIKGDLKSNRVVCPKCNYGDYCFNCSKKWRSNRFDICGNPDCKQLNNILSQSEWNKPFQLKNNGKVETFNLPHLRACPNPNCHEILNHSSGCKHMKCPKCNKQFCWVCLGFKAATWPCGSYNDYCGIIAQTQQF